MADTVPVPRSPWFETRGQAPVIECECGVCGYRRRVTSDEEADRIAERHWAAHVALGEVAS